MNKKMQVQQIEQTVANGAAATSAALAGASWMTELSAVLQLGATAVAIVAGAGAAWWHIEKAIAARKARLVIIKKTVIGRDNETKSSTDTRSG